MLLGIGLILFGLVFPSTVLGIVEFWVLPFGRLPVAVNLILESIFPLVGLIVLLIGFFMTERHDAA